MTRLITFTDENMTIAAEICRQSALSNNVQEATIYGMADIDEDFKEANKEIFASKRGPACWIWKPYLIDRELEQMNDGDILIYSDAGVEFVNNIRYVIDRMAENIWLFGNMFQHEHWCKWDIIERIFNGRDRPFGKQTQASVVLVKNTEWARTFIKEWLHYCLIPGLIDDSSSKTTNHPEFKENRHDQAILCTLAYKYNLPLHWWPAMYNAGNFTYEKTGYTDDYPVLFHHHRMRNAQFSSADELDRHMQNYFKRKYRVAV